jgi:hypothetical protein
LGRASQLVVDYPELTHFISINAIDIAAQFEHADGRIKDQPVQIVKAEGSF